LLHAVSRCERRKPGGIFLSGRRRPNLPRQSQRKGGADVDFRHRCLDRRVYLRNVDKAVPFPRVAPVDDDDLVARCLAGQRAAQKELFDREKRRVQATLFRVLGGAAPLDDLVQDVFLAVFRSLHTFRGEASLSTWIDRCAVRVALGHLRSRRDARHLELVPDAVASDDPSAERRTLAREATRRLYAALGGLPAKQRTAFALYAIDGRSTPEVAELMNATAVATKARIWRARRYVEKRARVDPVLAEYLTGAVSPARAGEDDEEPS
jgi:RNA polymerase sigma-70 factor (ECF subfamily)